MQGDLTLKGHLTSLRHRCTRLERCLREALCSHGSGGAGSMRESKLSITQRNDLFFRPYGTKWQLLKGNSAHFGPTLCHYDVSSICKWAMFPPCCLHPEPPAHLPPIGLFKLQTVLPHSFYACLQTHKEYRSRMAHNMNLTSNCQTRQSWSNMNEDSVPAFLISSLKCVQKHILVCCLAGIWECDLETGRTKNKRHPNYSMTPTSRSDVVRCGAVQCILVVGALIPFEQNRTAQTFFSGHVCLNIFAFYFCADSPALRKEHLSNGEKCLKTSQLFQTTTLAGGWSHEKWRNLATFLPPLSWQTMAWGGRDCPIHEVIEIVRSSPLILTSSCGRKGLLKLFGHPTSTSEEIRSHQTSLYHVMFGHVWRHNC